MKPTHFLACAAAVIAIAGCSSKQGDAATNSSQKLQQLKPPKGGDWTQVVQATPAGGFLMGNPNAKAQLIEYGSMTCPHCREFDEKGVTPLIDKYVRTGLVGYEFRNFVRDPFDLTAALIARCNSARSFFPLTRALYKDQVSWITKIQNAPKEQMQALQTLGPDKEFVTVAQLAGLQQWAAMRGVPTAKTSKCLVDQNEVNKLVQMQNDATTQFPDFPGTPTFILNGKMVELGPVTADQVWPALEGKIRAAIGK